MLEAVGLQLAAASIYATFWYIVALRLRRNDVADIAWGVGFIILTFVAQWAPSNPSGRAMLLLALVTVWGVRLSLHVGIRNWGKAEDSRYRKWREEWGRNATVRAYFQVFLLQGFLSVVGLLPVTYVLVHQESPLTAVDAMGASIWLVGFVFEAVADFQLVRFKSKLGSRGALIRSGLWKYTRHPNYFGEVTLWWGVWLIACSVSGGWATIVGPAMITALILWVSGIPMLEKKYEGNPEFESYRQRTSAFFPLPQRKL